MGSGSQDAGGRGAADLCLGRLKPHSTTVDIALPEAAPRTDLQGDVEQQGLRARRHHLDVQVGRIYRGGMQWWDAAQEIGALSEVHSCPQPAADRPRLDSATAGTNMATPPHPKPTHPPTSALQ